MWDNWIFHILSITKLQYCKSAQEFQTEQNPSLHGMVPVWYVPVLKSLHSKHKQELDTDRWIT